jgi:hypothetical protein
LSGVYVDENVNVNMTFAVLLKVASGLLHCVSICHAAMYILFSAKNPNHDIGSAIVSELARILTSTVVASTPSI